jgi:hypothetical protein
MPLLPRNGSSDPCIGRCPYSQHSRRQKGFVEALMAHQPGPATPLETRPYFTGRATTDACPVELGICVGSARVSGGR